MLRAKLRLRLLQLPDPSFPFFSSRPGCSHPGRFLLGLGPHWDVGLGLCHRGDTWDSFRLSMTLFGPQRAIFGKWTPA